MKVFLAFFVFIFSFLLFQYTNNTDSKALFMIISDTDCPMEKLSALRYNNQKKG